MVKRIINWFVFGIFFALVPLIIYILLSYICDIQIDLKNCIPELLFFTIMISATCLWDVNDMKKLIKEDVAFNLFFVALLILIIFSAILYGSIQLQNINDSMIIMSLEKTYTFSVLMSIFSATLGTIIQIVLSRIEVHNG